jgi:cytoskeletal protein RodZ
MTNEPKRDVGYRGALPTRQDRLAKPWILTVVAIFLLVIVLSIAGIPSRFIPEPTVEPLPSIPAASATPEPTESPSPSASPSGSASGSESPSPSASPTPAP